MSTELSGKREEGKALTMEEVSAVYGQLEKEIHMLTQSMGQLRDVHDRWMDNVALLDTFAKLPAGTAVQVPLTESLFVAATIDDCSAVKVDLGTGFYADKPCAEAATFFESRCQYAREQMTKIDGAVAAKRRQLEAIAASLQEAQAK